MNAIKQFEHELVDQSKSIQSMLPDGLDPKRFMRTVVNTLACHPQVDKLLKADRQSLFNALQKAAGDGLMVDGRESTLTVFKNTVTYMPMVQGLVKLARNSNEISAIVSEVVYSKDGFTYRPGVEEQPIHEPDWFGDRGEPVGAYSVVTTKEGEKIVSVLKKDRLIAIGQGGQNGHQYIPGKGAHFVEWWKKTVIKNVLKYSPKSTYLESAIAADNALTDPDRIPVVEMTPIPLKQRIAQHGKSSTVRTANRQPPARAVNDLPDGEPVTGTETTTQRIHRMN